MFLKLALLLFLTYVSGFRIQPVDDDVFIRCNYYGVFNYICTLAINNPNGIEFDTIEGTHAANRTNDDVRQIQGIYQNTKNIPQIICQQFPNLNEIFIEVSNLEILTVESLSNCGNLEFLFLGANSINSIPERIFINNPVLDTVGLFTNKISEIHENAFTGSFVKVLELDDNDLNLINPRWFPSSLEVLTFTRNKFTEIPNEGFQNLENLMILDLSHNNFGFIMPGAFNALRSLEHLRLSNISMSHINGELFRGLTSLRQLSLSYNNLRFLPMNLLDGLDNFRILEVGHNQLTELNSNTFGTSLSSLYEIYADTNQITSIDSKIIDEAQNLYYLFLESNFCVSRSFYGVTNDRESVRRELETCVDNFGYIECFYYDIGGGIYNCMLMIHNPTGRNTFNHIIGTHLPNKTDDDVIFVSSMMMHTANVPSIICLQFPSLQSISITYSQVEVVSYESFNGCRNLQRINLGQNIISEIQPRTFGKLRSIQQLTLNNNKITKIGEEAFIYSSLEEIDLEYNEINEFNAEIFNDVGATLKKLYLTQNNITELPSRAFSGLRNLEILSLNRNRLRAPSDAFRGLEALIYLNLGENELTEISGEWFSDLTSLTSLRIFSNEFTSIPQNAFNNLTSLTEIDISRNKLNILTEKSFGASLSTLKYVFSEHNRLNFIDPDFITKSIALDYLFVSNNLCIDTNFVNVRNDLEHVRNVMSVCRRNYDGFLGCSFYSPGFHYTCNLETMNIYGRENFFNIEGDHREGQSDSDVISITATNQHTQNVPVILCLTFFNTTEIIIEYSQVETVDMQTFSSCMNIEFISLSFNLISTIPNGTFAFKSKLERINLISNRIERIENLAFTETIINSIHLDYNRLTVYNAAAFNEVSSTLKFFSISDNRITSLPNAAFSKLSQVLQLNLANNPIGNIPEDSFHGMINLATLIIHDCEISELHENQFRGLNSLQDLRLNRNSLTSLPNGIFNELWNLTEIDLDYNNLYVIDAEAFGTTVTTLQYLFAWSNQIFAIDSQFFDNASELRWIFLSGNLCSNEDFLDVLYNRVGVRNSIGECLSFYDQLPEEISCNYIDNDIHYLCMMRIFNPGGRINFESVDGNHIENRGNSDINSVYIMNQITRIVPTVVCHQFENLNMLLITTSRLTFLNSNSFDGCNNLEILLLNFNHITEIPDRTFSSTPKLSVMQIVSNGIERIENSAFAGSSLQFLDLSDNNLREFNPTPFEAVNLTLADLMLPINHFTSLPHSAFANLRNLVLLQLNYNEFNDNIPPFTFSPLWRLETLTLINCELNVFDGRWFNGMGSLKTLQLSYNHFNELPGGAFNGLWGLQTLNLNDNNLRILNGTSFGFISNYISSIYASNNQLQAIDPILVQDSVRLNSLLLEQNLCVSQNFFNVSQNLPAVREELGNCITNFRPPLRCEFTDGDFYECNLRIQNPAGVNEFSPITGDHFFNLTDNEVGFVQIYRQTSPNFPSIICNQFQNVEEIFIDSSEFSQLDKNSFSGCSKLWLLFISSNKIEEIPARVFSENPNLLFVYLRSNKIRKINDEAFSGISLESLFIDGNQLTTVEGTWFAPINSTLSVLDLSWNQIQSLSENSFGQLGNLKDLKIDGNNLTSIAFGVFSGLENIEILSIRDSGLREFSSGWFAENSKLKNLYLDGNSINSLEDGVFDIFEDLFYVNLNRNQITTLSLASFGRSLKSIGTLNAMINQINAIDREIFENIENLQNLFLSGNVCVQRNFLNVINDLENVKNELEGCFNNFDL